MVDQVDTSRDALLDEQNNTNHTISSTNRSTQSSSTRLCWGLSLSPKWRSIIQMSFAPLVAILGFVLFYSLLITGTVFVVSICLFGNSIMHVIDSMKGDAGKPRLVSPISYCATTIILLSVIIILWSLLSVPDWTYDTLLGLEIAKWIQVFIIMLGYLLIRTSIEFLITRWCPFQDKPWFRRWFQGMLDVAYCALLLPAVALIMKVAPNWEHQTVLGLLAWKWISTIILIVVCQNAIGILVRALGVVVSRLHKHVFVNCKGPKCVFYYLEGLRRSMTFVLVALMHLFTWNLYFRHHFYNDSSTSLAHKVSNLGTWTFVSELLCGVMWVIKDFLLLSWQAHTIYNHSSKEIMRKLTHWYCLYELGLIKLKNNKVVNREAEQLSYLRMHVSQFIKDDYILVDTRTKIQETEWKRKLSKWKDAKDKIVKVVGDDAKPDDPKAKNTKLTIHDKQMLAYAFLPAGNARSLPDDQDISNFCKEWRKQYNLDRYKTTPDHKIDVSEEKLKEIISCIKNSILVENRTREAVVVELEQDKITTDEGLQVLYSELRDTNKKTKQDISANDFEPWMERAQQNCLQLRNLLAGGQGVVIFLNRLMIGFMFALVIIIWLRLTEILSIKVLVALTSPILALTFIFGESITTMFQGFVFAYIMHPFAVGDLRVIDQTQMEVKKISISRTIFYKVGTDDEVIYPNSVLASQAMISYEENLHDSVEFSFTSDATNSTNIESLKDSIRHIVSKSGSLHDSEDAMEENTQQNVRSGSEPQSLGSGNGETELQNDDDDQRSESGTSTRHDVTVVVKQIEDTIFKMKVYFTHDDTIGDMTVTQAFYAKIKRKSKILAEIAEFVSRSTTNAVVRS